MSTKATVPADCNTKKAGFTRVDPKDDQLFILDKTPLADAEVEEARLKKQGAS